MSETSKRPSRLELARLVSGELAPPAQEALEQRVRDDPAAQRALDELQHNSAAFAPRAEAHRARLMDALERSGARKMRARSGWHRGRYAIGALAAAAAVLLVLVLHPREATPPGTGPTAQAVAFKGKLALQVVARRGQRQFVVQRGQRLQAGDDLRFVVTTDGPGFLSVLSVDGRGVVSPFYPDVSPSRDPRPLAVASAGRHALQGSVVLDDAPGPEHLVVVFSHRRFDRDAVHRRVARALAGKAAADLPGAEVQWITVEKAR